MALMLNGETWVQESETGLRTIPLFCTWKTEAGGVCVCVRA